MSERTLPVGGARAMKVDSRDPSAQVHLHARAEHCTLPFLVQGRRIVSYRGEEYVMLGFYFARNHNGHRDLYYILRLADGREKVV